MSKDDQQKARALLFFMRIKAQHNDFVELDERFFVGNGGQRCDTYKGPCSCGALHEPGDIEKKCAWVYK